MGGGLFFFLWRRWCERLERAALVVAVAGGAVVADAALGTVAVDAQLDRGEIEIAGALAVHDLVAVDAREAFLVERVIEFSERHPASGDAYIFDQGRGIGGFGRLHFVADGATREGGALAIGELGAFVGEEDHVLEVFAGFVLALDAGAFVGDVADEVIAAGDALDIATEFFVLDVEAAEKGSDVIGIAVRQGEAGRFFIELESVAFLAVLGVGDGQLVFAARVLFVAFDAIHFARDVSFAHVDGVIELEGVGVLDAVADLAELGMVLIKRGNDIGVAIGGALTRLDFCGVSLCGIDGRMGMRTGAELTGFCHQFGRAVAGDAVGIVGGWHDAGVFLVALVAGEIRGHVRLVNVLSLVACQAFLIHGSGFDGTTLKEFCGR